MKTFTPHLAFTITLLIAGLSSFGQNNRLWATYFGGAGDEAVYYSCLTTDLSGHVYIAGYTASTSGIASGGYQNTYGGGTYDAFLAKFNSTGTLLWATYYGGPAEEYGYSVSTDDQGYVYLSGQTASNTGIASGGFQNNYGGGVADAFLAKFDTDGNLFWATYYGDAGTDQGFCVKAVNEGTIYLSGNTTSSSNIASGGFQNTYMGIIDAFLVKFDTYGNRLWATYYGETGPESGFSIATDASAHVYLIGFTSSIAGIASGGFQNSFGGGAYDSYLARFDQDGNRIWATYYGGSSDDAALAVSTDQSGNIYMTGSTTSANNISSNGFQNSLGGAIDAFLVKFDTSGNRLWATYYGDAEDDHGSGVTTDASNHVYLCGSTESTINIASGGFQNTHGGGSDAYLVTFDSDGSRLCATYYGGSDDDYAADVSAASGNIYLEGFTESASGMTTSGSYQTTIGGGFDTYFVKFSACITTGTEATILPDITQIFPNPGSGIFYLKDFQNDGKKIISVSTITGTGIFEKQIEENQTVLDLSLFPDGVYLVNILDETGTIERKIIVKQNH